MELYAIGDSFVFGSGVPAAKRWTTLCAEKSGWTVHNLGVGGDTLPGILTRETCVLVMGGTNDVFCDCPPELLRPNAAAILQQLASKGLCAIACAAPLPTGEKLPGSWELFADPVACIPKLNDFGDWLSRYCGAFGFPYLDLRELYAEGGLCLDGIHPNAAGHGRIADRLTELLRSLAG